MAYKSKSKKKNKPVSLTEFRAWLEGVEELQPNDWTPTADQWKLIRTKMDCIVEEVIVEQISSPPATQYAPPINHPNDFAQPVNHPNVTAPPMEQPQELIQAQPFVPEMETTALGIPVQPMSTTGNLPSSMTPAPDGKIKTPHIDTSKQKYGSGFE